MGVGSLPVNVPTQFFDPDDCGEVSMSPTTAAQHGRVIGALNLNLASFDQPAALASLAVAAISSAEFDAAAAPPGHWSSAYTVLREGPPSQYETNTGISSHAQSTVPFLPNSISSSLHAVLSPESTSAVHGFPALRSNGQVPSSTRVPSGIPALERAEDVPSGIPGRIAARGGVVPLPTIHSIPGIPAPEQDSSDQQFMTQASGGFGDPAPEGDEDGDPVPTLASAEGVPPQLPEPAAPAAEGSAHSTPHDSDQTPQATDARESASTHCSAAGSSGPGVLTGEPSAAAHHSQAGLPVTQEALAPTHPTTPEKQPLEGAAAPHSSPSCATPSSSEAGPAPEVEPPFGIVDEFGRVAVRDADTGKVYWLGGDSPEKQAVSAKPKAVAAVPPRVTPRAAPPTPPGVGGAASGRAAAGAVTDSPQDGKFYQGHSTFVGMHALQRRRSESVSAGSRAAEARSPPGATAAASGTAAGVPPPGAAHRRKRSFFARLFQKKSTEPASSLEHVPAYVAADAGQANAAANNSFSADGRQGRLRSGSSGSSGSRSRSGSRGRARKKWDVSTTYTQRDVRELTHVRFCQALTDHAQDGEHIWCSAFSKDGQFFASAGGTEGAAVVRCWTVQPWTESLRAANEVRSKAQIAKEQEERAKGPRGAPALLAAQRAEAASLAGGSRGVHQPQKPTASQDQTPHKDRPSSLPAAAAAGAGAVSAEPAGKEHPQSAGDSFESPQAATQGVNSASPLKATPGSRMKHINMVNGGGALSSRDTPEKGNERVHDSAHEDPAHSGGSHSRSASIDTTAAAAAASAIAGVDGSAKLGGVQAATASHAATSSEGSQAELSQGQDTAASQGQDTAADQRYTQEVQSTSGGGVHFKAAAGATARGVDEGDVGCGGHSISGHLDSGSEEELPPALISGYGPEGTPLPLFESQPVQVWRGHTGFIVDMAWSRANLLVTASMDRFVRLWHPAHTQCIHKFQHPSSVTAVDFHPVADNYFVSGSFDRRVRVWSLETGKVVLWTTVKTMPSSIAFSPDAQQIAVGRSDGVVSLYYTDGLRFRTDIEVRNRRGRLSGGRKVSGIEFAADGAHMLISTNDSRLRLLRMDNLRCVMKYAGPTLWHTQIHASFDAAGERVICGSEDTGVFVWRTFHDGYTPMLNPVYTGYRYDKNKSYESFSISNGQPATGAFDLQQLKQAAASSSAHTDGATQRNLCVTSTHFAPVPSVAMARPPSFLLPLQTAGAVVDPALRTPAFQGLKAAADAETLTETSVAEMTAVAEKAGRPLERCAALFVCCDSDGIIRVYEQLGAAKVI